MDWESGFIYQGNILPSPPLLRSNCVISSLMDKRDVEVWFLVFSLYSWLISFMLE